MSTPTTPNPAPRGQWHHCPTCGEATNYEPNQVQWLPGALVVHDYDAKKPNMLMVLKSVDGHFAVTTYLDGKTVGRKRELNNPLCLLHDPARWGISTATRVEEVRST